MSFCRLAPTLLRLSVRCRHVRRRYILPPHAAFVSCHRPSAVHRVGIQPVAAPGHPSLVSLAQTSPASGALRRDAALFRFGPDRDGLPAIPALKLTPRLTTMVKIGIFEATIRRSSLFEKVSQGQDALYHFKAVGRGRRVNEAKRCASGSETRIPRDRHERDSETDGRRVGGRGSSKFLNLTLRSVSEATAGPYSSCRRGRLTGDPEPSPPHPMKVALSA